jgi:four helix bundle protein
VAHFRFEDLEIWRLACELAVEFHTVASRLEEAKLYRYAEQLRAAGLSVSNNIAEGSGSLHPSEFLQFLNIARRSDFECASMLHIFRRLEVLTEDETMRLLERCDEVSRKIVNYAKTLKPDA